VLVCWSAIMAMQSQFGTQLVVGAQVTYTGPRVLYEAADEGFDGKNKDTKILHQGMQGRVVAVDKNRPQVLWDIPDSGKFKNAWSNNATDDKGNLIKNVVEVKDAAGAVLLTKDNTANWERANAVFVKGDKLHHRVVHHEPQQYKDCGVSTVTLSGSPLLPGDEVEYVYSGDRMQQAYAGMVGRVNKLTNSGHAQVNFGPSGGGQEGGVFVVPRRLVHHGSSEHHHYLLEGAQRGAVMQKGFREG